MAQEGDERLQVEGFIQTKARGPERWMHAVVVAAVVVAAVVVAVVYTYALVAAVLSEMRMQ